MSIVSTIANYIKDNNLIDDEALIVGCSGGADSVALLRILKDICPKNEIHVVHINHQLRGIEADLDEAFVNELCKGLNIPCKIYSYDVLAISKELHRSIEDTGRILRYKAFEEYSNEVFGDRKSLIAVAHHKDDLAETMLMNLSRGSGLDGLISPKNKTGKVIRPLLCVSKEEILDYLKSINQSYKTDATNFETDCTRNIWRNEIIPSISNASKRDLSKSLFSTYELLNEDASYMALVARNVFERIYNPLTKTIDIKALSDEYMAIKSRVIRLFWETRFGNLIDLERTHVDSILKLFMDSNSSGKTINLPFNRTAYVINGNGGLETNEKLEETTRLLFKNSGFVFCDGISTMDTKDNTVLPHSDSVLSVQIVENIENISYNFNSWFYPISDVDDVKDLTVGNVNTNYEFGKAGSDCHKEVGRLLMDRKIPVWLREKVFGVTKGDRVLWIPGIGHSIGFTDEVSYKRFIENPDGEKIVGKYLLLTII